MRRLSMSKAINEAIKEEMIKDSNVILLGEDVGVMGSPWGVVKGLYDEFGAKRVIETPISEGGFTGMAVGAAMRGMRPVIELMYADFFTVAMDQIMNQAAKMRYMTGGQVSVPMVIRAPVGTGRHTGGQHTQSIEAFMAHIPGLKVVSPSNAADAKGLLKTAIRDNDPVIFLEHVLLYGIKEEVSEEDYTIPFGKAEIKRPGKDITLLTWSLPVNFTLEAAEKLALEGIDAEVIDLRSLVPLDWETIKQSIEKTHRAVIIEYGVKRCGIGAEISAQIMEDILDQLDAPVGRIAMKNVVSPYTPVLEETVIPNKEIVYKEVKKLLGNN